LHPAGKVRQHHYLQGKVDQLVQVILPLDVGDLLFNLLQQRFIRWKTPSEDAQNH
jgi:hypothetical protein